MSQKRHFHPDVVYHLSNRTLRRMFMLTPTPACNAIVKRVLARSIEEYGIEVYAYTIMSNHFHMLARAPGLNMDKFMQYFQSQVARRLNEILGREGSMFPKRYRAEPMLDDASLLEKVEYVMTNPVRAALVRHPRLWPGLSSWSQMMGAVDEEAPRITVLPHLEHLGVEELGEFYEGLIAKTVSQNRHRSFLGPTAVQHQKWTRRPKCKSKKSRQPLCHAKDLRTWRLYRKFKRLLRISYRECANLLALGEHTLFPHGTFPPGKRRAPDMFAPELSSFDPKWCLARRRQRVEYEMLLDGFLASFVPQ